MPLEDVFQLQTSLLDGAFVLTAVGEIDLATAPRLGDAITAAAAVRCVVVDLTEVTFIDSSGLNVLVQGRRNLARRDIALRIVSPEDRAAYRVFELTQLNSELEIVPTLDDALRRVGAPS